MNCPRDGETLVAATIGTHCVERCPRCSGTWLDRDELRKAKDEAAPDLNWLDFDLWRDAAGFRARDDAAVCPSCGAKMVTLEYGDTAVEVDACTKCGGTWLDGGEFGRIVERLREEAAARDVPDYVRASLSEAGEIAGGSEGLASEWRDFMAVLRLLEHRIMAEHPRLMEILLGIERSVPG